MNNNRN